MGTPEKLWLQSISLSHKTWCACRDYRKHIPGWSDSTGNGTPAADIITEDIAVQFELNFEDTGDAGEDGTR
nr:MAG: ORF2 [Giant panda anellovirus]